MIAAMRRRWKYMTARMRQRQEERADPQVQLEQAIEEAKKQHQLLTEQAAAVISNQHQLQIQLGRAIDDVEKLKASTAQALRLEDQAARDGDPKRAAEFEQTARAFATNLASAEQRMEEMKSLHDTALVAAAKARSAVDQNRGLLQEKVAERSRLLSQLEQARMQERMNAAMRQMSASSLDTLASDTPTLDEVRTKIEARYAKALAGADLAQGSVDVRMLEVQQTMLESKGDARLEEIRKSLGLPPGGTTPTVAVSEPRALTAGTDGPDEAADAADAPAPAKRPRSTRTPAE